MPYLLMSTGRAAGAEAEAGVEAASAVCSAPLPPLSGCATDAAMEAALGAVSVAGVDIAVDQNGDWNNHKD